MMENKNSHWKKDIGLLIGGQTISMFGSSLVQFAIIFYITLNTKSGVMLAISTLCAFIPQMFISFFAGVWADRYNKKLLIVLSDGGIALATLIIAILFSMGYESLWLLFAVSIVRSLGSGIHSPSSSALLPILTPEDQLMKVNGLQGTIQSIMTLLSPAIGGALLGQASITVIFYIDVVTAIIGIALLFLVKIPKQERHNIDNTVFEDFMIGFKYVKESMFIKSLLTFYAWFQILLVPAALLTPLMIATRFGDEVWRLTANEMFFGGGMIIGGLIITTWGGFKKKTHTIALATFCFGILNIMMGSIPIFWFFVSLTGLIGLIVPLVNTPSMTLIQENVEPDKMGRVFSFLMVLGTLIMPLGMVIYGPIADEVGVEMLLIITGIGLIIQSIWLFKSKKFEEALTLNQEDTKQSEVVQEV